MTEPFGIGLIGCGTVGAAVAQVLMVHGERLMVRAGRPLQLQAVLVRDADKPRDIAIPPQLLARDLATVLRNPQIQVVCELVGGTGWAREAVLAALAAGKHVVTANKALLALHGTEVFAAARAAGKSIAFEASVAGGVPVIAALAQGLAANQILSVQGILNGTCNYILTQMTEAGRDYAASLAEAQALGFAEADPTLDVGGFDSAHKLAVLVRIAFGVVVTPDQIARRGIAELAPLDVRFAGELGYTIKLLAEAWCSDAGLALHVGPVLVKRGTPLAEVRGAYNAVRACGDLVGDTIYYGRGAGGMPTASAVLADVIDLAARRTPASFAATRLDASRSATLLPTEEVRSRFYLRLTVADRAGVLAEAAALLAMENISIASVIQHEAPDDADELSVSLVIMTHAAPTGRLRDALRRINASDHVREPAVYYPVGD